MIKVHIPETELFDSSTNRFSTVKAQDLLLEHSLISVSKWEAIWHKPFLAKEKKTVEETLDYIRQMTIGNVPDPIVYTCIPPNEIKRIMEYIDDPMTATTFSKYAFPGSKGGGEAVTSELIYYWMVGYQIPFDPCEKWHINRLLTLIKICNVKSQKPKKMSTSDLRNQNKAINEARRRQLGSKG